MSNRIKYNEKLILDLVESKGLSIQDILMAAIIRIIDSKDTVSDADKKKLQVIAESVLENVHSLDRIYLGDA